MVIYATCMLIGVTFEMTNITLLERYIQKFIQEKDMVFSMLTALHISLITHVI